MLKIWGFTPQNWGAKPAYFVTVLISRKLCQKTKNRAEVLKFYPPSVNARRDYSGGAENAGVENAGVEKAGAITYGKPSEKKTLKTPGV